MSFNVEASGQSSGPTPNMEVLFGHPNQPANYYGPLSVMFKPFINVTYSLDGGAWETVSDFSVGEYSLRFFVNTTDAVSLVVSAMLEDTHLVNSPMEVFAPTSAIPGVLFAGVTSSYGGLTGIRQPADGSVVFVSDVPFDQLIFGSWLGDAQAFFVKAGSVLPSNMEIGSNLNGPSIVWHPGNADGQSDYAVDLDVVGSVSNTSLTLVVKVRVLRVFPPFRVYFALICKHCVCFC